MSYLNIIKPYQSVDLSNHIPFYVAGERVGWITPSFASDLKQFTDIFVFEEKRIDLADRFDTFETRSQAIKEALNTLADQGVVKHNPYGPHNPSEAFQKVDIYPVGGDIFVTPLLGIERYYYSLFGIVSHNASVVGYTGDSVWVAKRSPLVAAYPNMLDHTISGSCTTDDNIIETVRHEAIDEASLTEDLIDKINPIHPVHLAYINKNGDFCDEIINIFDVELPNDFIPQTKFTDEISGFHKLSFDALNEEILNGNQMMDFSKIVFIYFLIKHQYITEKEKEYKELIQKINHHPSDNNPLY